MQFVGILMMNVDCFSFYYVLIKESSGNEKKQSTSSTKIKI